MNKYSTVPYKQIIIKLTRTRKLIVTYALFCMSHSLRHSDTGLPNFVPKLQAHHPTSEKIQEKTIIEEYKKIGHFFSIFTISSIRDACGW